MVLISCQEINRESTWERAKRGLEEGRGIKEEGEVVGKRVLSWDTSNDKVGHPTPG